MEADRPKESPWRVARAMRRPTPNVPAFLAADADPNKDIEAYFYLAHAEDICDYKGTPIQVDVPDKSVVLQSSVCGIGSFWSDTIVDVFGDPDYESIFKHPFRKTDGVENLHSSSVLLGSPLEVHAPDINIGIIKSKIYTIGYYKPEGRFGSSGVRRAGNTSSYEFLHDFAEHTLSIGPFIRLFRGSVRPTEDEVTVFLNTHPDSDRFKREGLTEGDIFLFNRHPLFTFDFIDFVKTHPGIHYHLLCRDVPKYCKKGAAKRRELSATVHGHSKKATKKVIDHAKLLRYYNDIQGLESLLRTMTVPEIKEFFEEIMKDTEYRTGLHTCETRDSPVYFIKRLMDITKEDASVYKKELVKAMERCELNGDINKLADIVIKQQQNKRKKRKTRRKSRSKQRSKTRSKPRV
jgi:hypothetical protein